MSRFSDADLREDLAFRVTPSGQQGMCRGRGAVLDCDWEWFQKSVSGAFALSLTAASPGSPAAGQKPCARVRRAVGQSRTRPGTRRTGTPGAAPDGRAT